MIGISERCESLELLLSRVGMTKSLPDYFTSDALKRWIGHAQQEKIDWML